MTERNGRGRPVSPTPNNIQRWDEEKHKEQDEIRQDGKEHNMMDMDGTGRT